MPRYLYTAKSLEGEDRSGAAEAKDPYQLSQALRKEGLILIKAETEEDKFSKKIEISLPFKKVSLTDKMFFARNLQIMISAGLSLPRALEILLMQTNNKKFKEALLNIKEEIMKGKSFSESISSYPDIFSELFQNMIKVGEETGTVEDVLKVLSLQMEKESELKSKIVGAMIYPSVIIVFMMGIGVLMLMTIVPKLAETFTELKVELPFTTKIVIGLADFLTQKWYLAIMVILGLVFFLNRALKTKIGRRIIDKFTLKIPVISSIIKKANLAFTTRTLSSLISAGVALPQSLEITARTLGNIYYRQAISESVDEVRKGVKLSDVLKKYEDIYPPMMTQMLAVGEETGETSGILSKMADFFEEEVANATKNLTSIVEPVLMIIIGGVVGFFAVAMIQPMYSMLGAIE